MAGRTVRQRAEDLDTDALDTDARDEQARSDPLPVRLCAAMEAMPAAAAAMLIAGIPGAAAEDNDGGDGDEDGSGLASTHGALMWFAFAFLVPGGIFMSRYGQHYFPNRWFVSHIFMQFTALILAVAGFGVAIDSFEEPLESAHGQLGTVLFVFLIAQIFVGGFARPEKSNPKTTARVVWEYGHRTIGIFLAFFGIVNVWLGLRLEGEEGGSENAFVGLHVIWFIVLLICIGVLEWFLRGKQRSNPDTDDLGQQMHERFNDENGDKKKSDDHQTDSVIDPSVVAGMSVAPDNEQRQEEPAVAADSDKKSEPQQQIGTLRDVEV
mmetsp:Transcript_7025/g.17170  ORF Transcript_7025/g.17170 Transcript_7025/m.17170 type:complete len:323 (-) Transcript_7025:190-1158(-)